MAFTAITAGQTDADSPINETLMDLIRTNLDDLDSRIAGFTGDDIIKGWINFDGTGTIAIKDSFNVSTIVDNGTGDYKVNWDTNFANANYAVVGMCGNDGSYTDAYMSLRAQAAGSTRVLCKADSVGVSDYDTVSVIAIGDQ